MLRVIIDWLSRLMDALHFLNLVLRYHKTERDVPYLQSFATALEEVSKKEYVEGLLNDKDININMNILKSEFKEASFNKDILLSNAKMIQKFINLAKAFEYMDDKTIIIKVKSPRTDTYFCLSVEPDKLTDVLHILKNDFVQTIGG